MSIGSRLKLATVIGIAAAPEPDVLAMARLAPVQEFLCLPPDVRERFAKIKEAHDERMAARARRRHP